MEEIPGSGAEFGMPALSAVVHVTAAKPAQQPVRQASTDGARALPDLRGIQAINTQAITI